MYSLLMGERILPLLLHFNLMKGVFNERVAALERRSNGGHGKPSLISYCNKTSKDRHLERWII